LGKKVNKLNPLEGFGPVIQSASSQARLIYILQGKLLMKYVTRPFIHNSNSSRERERERDPLSTLNHPEASFAELISDSQDR